MKTFLILPRCWGRLIVLSWLWILAGCGGSDIVNGKGPTIVEQPRNLTVTEGQSATFKVLAEGTPSLSYQWKRNDVDIDGAKSAQYVLLSPSLYDSRAKFSVVVTNSLHRAASKAAVLTVEPPPKGNTFYLDANNGDDSSGDGSEANPYKTVARLWPELGGGDLVLLASGNYAAFVAGRTWPANDIDRGWNCSPVDIFRDWVSFRAAPGQDPHFESISLGTWNSVPGTSMPFSQIGNSDAYLRFDGVTVDNGVTIMGSRHVEIRNSRIHRPGDLVGSLDILQTKGGVAVYNGRHVTIEGSDISHVTTGLSVASTDFIFRGNSIRDSTHDGMRIYGGDNLLIEGNEIHDLDDGVDDASGLEWNMHVDGVHIFINYYANKMPHDLNGLTLRGNTFYHIEAMGIMLNASKPPTTNYRNFVFENNVMGPVGGNLLHWGATIEGFVFRHNTIVYTPETSWRSPYRTVGATQYNVSWWPGGNGQRIYNNIFVDGKSSQPNPADSRFALIANNLYKTAPQRALQRGEMLLTSLP